MSDKRRSTDASLNANELTNTMVIATNSLTRPGTTTAGRRRRDDGRRRVLLRGSFVICENAVALLTLLPQRIGGIRITV